MFMLLRGSHGTPCSYKIYIYIYICIYIYIYIRHRAFSGEACQFLFSTLLVLLHLYETLVYRSPGSLGLGDLFWVGPCPEAGHGGSCFRDPTPPGTLLPTVTHCYSLLPAVTRVPSKVVKNDTSKRVPKSTPNKQKGSPTEARKVSRIMTKPIFPQNV